MSASVPEFFDVVRLNVDAVAPEIRGKSGYIIGMAEEDGVLHLSAWIYAREEVWSVKAEHLTFLGHKDDVAAAEYRRRSTIRVSVDPESGEGTVR
ncbi:Imm31 family immunity protein [uncultured Brevundimonas sp.]|uniref:Imm31 family immunity protein n=1 Tax=uncultured Brevundimonas sp. TaxID=213418 RepID=UPI00262C2A2A|nr:Imm31 family immunity protein [uncultured Brevundimonas sp.]